MPDEPTEIVQLLCALMSSSRCHEEHLSLALSLKAAHPCQSKISELVLPPIICKAVAHFLFEIVLTSGFGTLELDVEELRSGQTLRIRCRSGVCYQEYLHTDQIAFLRQFAQQYQASLVSAGLKPYRDDGGRPN